MKNLYIRVEGDFNDGDYISETTNISNLKKEKVLEIYNKLNKYDPEEEDDEFYDEISGYLPSMDNMKVHTITNVVLLKIEKIEKEDLI